MIELNPEFEANIEKFYMKYQPEILAFFLSFLGVGMIAQIGVDFFNNKYIALPFIILIAVGYLRMKKEQAWMIKHK